MTGYFKSPLVQKGKKPYQACGKPFVTAKEILFTKLNMCKGMTDGLFVTSTRLQTLHFSGLPFRMFSIVSCPTAPCSKRHCPIDLLIQTASPLTPKELLNKHVAHLRMGGGSAQQGGVVGDQQVQKCNR